MVPRGLHCLSIGWIALLSLLFRYCRALVWHSSFECRGEQWTLPTRLLGVSMYSTDCYFALFSRKASNFALFSRISYKFALCKKYKAWTAQEHCIACSFIATCNECGIFRVFPRSLVISVQNLVFSLWKDFLVCRSCKWQCVWKLFGNLASLIDADEVWHPPQRELSWGQRS